MLRAGQQSTFPKLLFIQNRMKIELLIEEGLLLGGLGGAKDKALKTREPTSLQLHRQAVPNLESYSEYEHEPLHSRWEYRRFSVIQELRRQGGVFFDDSGVDGEETGGSEDDKAQTLDGHK